LFQNPDDRDTFVRLGLVPADKTVIIKGSGVDMTRFTPTPQPEGPPLILFAGRLIWQKGIGDFVAAARALKTRGLEARFVIVGYPEASSPAAVPAGTLDAWAAEGVIEWWGRRDDMPAVYAGAHIVCLPSSYGEGVPKVLIEAAACGRPAVATDAPGCREIVHDGANGLLVPVGDHEALCAALETLATDPARRAQMGMRGRQIAEAEFALTQVLDRTLALYRELLGE
jgi:glycosyltransferase involved in cell wall biosynthesis